MTDLRFYFPERDDLEDGHYAEMLYGQEWPENWPVGTGENILYTTGVKPRVLVETADSFFAEVPVKPEGQVLAFTDATEYYEFADAVEAAIKDRRYLRSLPAREEREILRSREKESKLAKARLQALKDKGAERQMDRAVFEGEDEFHNSFEDDITATMDDYNGFEGDFDPGDY